MFSGGDSSDGINSLNQLNAFGFINQVAVSNAMAAGQNIDWAQLAQQWIQMRDNSAEEKRNDVSETDSKVIEPCSHSSNFDEKGEADMDMDDEDQVTDDKMQTLKSDFTVSNSTLPDGLNQPWCYNEETPRTSNFRQWNPWPNPEVLPQPVSNQKIRPAKPTSHIPSLLNINVPNPNEIRVMADIPNQPENATNMMDAAKRKGLPAWIREGLEKMEREKQKQLEREQNEKNTNPSDMDNAETLVKPLNFPHDGGFATIDDNSTDNEDAAITTDANDVRDINLQRENEVHDRYDSVGKTYEQKLADLMVMVRRTLTELLLEATNEEICKVADETIKTFKSKASSAQVIRKSALSTLTGKLGLAAYIDSSSEDNCDDDMEINSSKKDIDQSDTENDSEEELRNVIHQKRRAFIKTSAEIEERVALAAAREEEKVKFFSRLKDEDEEDGEREHNHKKIDRSLVKEPTSSGHSGHNTYKGYEKDFGEITETKIQHINGKRQWDRGSRRERTTRFSDNKDKYVSVPNAATFLTNVQTSGNSNSTAVALSSKSQRQTAIPDINGLLPNYANAGMTNVLNAADAALAKVLKGKEKSASPEKQSRRHGHDHRDYAPAKKRQRTSSNKNSRSCSKSSSSSTSSTSSSSSSDSDSSSSHSSRHSKYSHQSTTKHKPHSSADRQSDKSHKDHRRRDDRKYSSSSSSYKKRARKLTKSRYHRDVSSGSEDDYRRRHKYDSHYSRNSSHSHTYTSSRRDSDREHSRSQSRSSFSSSSNRKK